VSKCFWKNGANRLAQHKVAIDLQFVKTVISAKHNKARYAYSTVTVADEYNLKK